MSDLAHQVALRLPVLTLAISLILVAACQGQTATPSANVAAEIGGIAPDITVHKLENGQVGTQVQLSALRGKPVVLNFWATWCEPCRQEYPILDQAFRDYRESKQLQVIGINVQDPSSPEAVQQFLADTGVVFPIWLDANGAANRDYRVQALPTTVFIDPAGVIRQVRIGGPLTRAYLDEQLVKIFQ